MSYSINTTHLPRLRNFAQASQWEQGVTPIRGSTLKPLGKRTAKHMQILRHNAGADDESIACRLYNTDCVTYYKDGRIQLYHAGYTTQSTAKFIARICPYGRVVLKDGHMLFQHGWCGVHGRGGVYAIPREGLMIGAGTTIENPLPFKVHTIDRVAIKRVRAKHKEFKEYAINMCKLSGGVLGAGGRLGGNGRIPLCSPDTDEGMQEWAHMAGEFMRDAATHRYDYPNRKYTYTTTPQALARAIENVMLKMYRDEVFVEETLPLGEYRKDAYKKYFR